MDHDSSTERCPGFLTALLLRCGQGDQRALLALMELFYAPVRACVATGRPDDEADVLVGRAFVQVWQHASSYEPRRQPGPVAWVLTEAASAVRDATPVLVAS